MKQTPSYFFYDLETFGLDPKQDRIAQFAGIRTDHNFNIIGEPVNLYCQPALDYIPNPESILITGITLEECEEKGLPESEFASAIHTLFSVPNTTILGYNNIRFDDEMIRYLFYRNFIDPYAYTWQNGNSRWDLLDVVRATYALRPEGIVWPTNEENPNIASLRLEHLTKANNLLHEKAHDALSDVYATIAIAKLLKTHQPKLFKFFSENRLARNLKRQIDLDNHTPFTHVSGMFGADNQYLAAMMPIAMHPWNRNGLIAVNLMGNVEQLLTLSSADIHAYLYTKDEALPEGIERMPLKLIHLNRTPIIAPLGVLKGVNQTSVDVETVMRNFETLFAHRFELMQKLTEVYREKRDFSALEPQDPEAQLYDGFFPDEDKKEMERILRLSFDEIAETEFFFEDARLSPLLFRYRAKNAPFTLNKVEQDIWNQFARVRRNSYKEAFRPIYDALLESDLTEDQRTLLESCRHYYYD